MTPFGMDPYDVFQLKLAELERRSQYARYRKLARESHRKNKEEQRRGHRHNRVSGALSTVKSHFHLGRQQPGSGELLEAGCAEC